jgi:hypothetical protein
MTDSLSVCLGIEYPCGTCNQILLPFGMLLSEICGLVSVRLDDWPTICSVITQWSKSRRTRNHTLLPHLRLPQPGEPGSHIYIPQEQGGAVIPLGIGFPLHHLLRLAGLRWRYSKPPTYVLNFIFFLRQLFTYFPRTCSFDLLLWQTISFLISLVS